MTDWNEGEKTSEALFGVSVLWVIQCLLIVKNVIAPMNSIASADAIVCCPLILVLKECVPVGNGGTARLAHLTSAGILSLTHRDYNGSYAPTDNVLTDTLN